MCYFNSCYSIFYENEWSQFYPQGKTYFTLELKGDTVINGKTYMKMHKYSGASINEKNDTVLVYLREKDRIVYGIMPDRYPDCYVGYGMWVDNVAINIIQAAASGNEFILYDFNDPENYYSNVYARSSSSQSRIIYDGNDAIPVGDKMARRYRFNYASNYGLYFIEGVGYDGYYSGYTLGYLCVNKNQVGMTDFEGFYLSHVIQDGEIIYKGINYEQVMPCDGRLPIVQEDKIWVNERVIVNKGDTIRSYYSYVISGNDLTHPRDDRKLCHYYNGMKIDPENDSIVSILNELNSKFGGVISYFNLPIEEISQKNQNILKYYYFEGDHSGLLYWMRHGESEQTISSYLSRQNDPKVLNEENFFAVDPIEINGFKCDRYALVDEQGEVLAYLVEGIGFDSRDMGDLLTPFTRRPDADADYQEWCGLSHVIKDGEIIYKGLCYDAERVEAMSGASRGDLNGDGMVNVTDVTLLIDIVLNSSAPGGPSRVAGDMNDSGDLNITDVTLLIEQALMQ